MWLERRYDEAIQLQQKQKGDVQWNYTERTMKCMMNVKDKMQKCLIKLLQLQIQVS